MDPQTDPANAIALLEGFLTNAQAWAEFYFNMLLRPFCQNVRSSEDTEEEPVVFPNVSRQLGFLQVLQDLVNQMHGKITAYVGVLSKVVLELLRNCSELIEAKRGGALTLPDDELAEETVEAADAAADAATATAGADTLEEELSGEMERATTRAGTRTK